MSLASERRAAVERAFPGVTCTRVAFEIVRYEPDNSAGNCYPDRSRYQLSTCVKGHVEVLIAHKLVTRDDIDALPPSGKTYGLRRLSNGIYQASVHWTDWVDYGARKTTLEGRDMAARLGIVQVEPEATRRREIRGREVSWTTAGIVIEVNWKALRARVAFEREARAS